MEEMYRISYVRAINCRFHYFHLQLPPLLLLSMLLISRSMDLWKICISSLCSIDKLSFPPISIFSFLLYYLWSMLLVSRSMDLWKICIFSLCSNDKLSFSSFSIFSFLLMVQYLLLCYSSSSYSFHFCHLSLMSSVLNVIIFLWPFIFSSHLQHHIS